MTTPVMSFSPLAAWPFSSPCSIGKLDDAVCLAHWFRESKRIGGLCSLCQADKPTLQSLFCPTYPNISTFQLTFPSFNFYSEGRLPNPELFRIISRPCLTSQELHQPYPPS